MSIKLQLFWKKFNEYLNINQIDNDYIYELKKLRNAKDTIILDTLLEYIIEKHPLMGSKFEDIKDSNNNLKKYEVLMADDILEDQFISMFFNNRLDLFTFLTNPELGLSASINLSYMHIENIKRHIEANNNNARYTINISEIELLSDCFIEYMLKNKHLNGFIEIELLESYINFTNKKVLKNVKILHSNGFKIILDDFGDNYSNLERIEELQVIENEIINSNKPIINSIKIDGTMLISLLLEKEFFNTTIFKDSFSKNNMADIMVHFKNYKSRLKLKDYECKLFNMDMEEIFKDIDNYEDFIDFFTPYIDKMRKYEEKLISENKLIPATIKLNKVLELYDGGELEIIFEFINLNAIKEYIYECLTNKVSCDRIYMQGYLYGCSTKNILAK
jgi:regulator of replication initiation timing